tara:strand:+ start:68 stop:664 length:597 start_codon:yes stop_codon:yes gene_type:complete
MKKFILLAIVCLITFSSTVQAQNRGRWDIDAVKARVESAVESGRMTQEQADALYKGLKERTALGKKEEGKTKPKKDDGIQRKGSKPLPQSKERGKLQERREGSRYGRSRGSRMWGRNEATNKGRRRPHCGCQVQNFRMWERNRFFQSRHTMDQRQKAGRGQQHHQRPDRGRTKPSSREDSLQRPSRGRNKSGNKRLRK